MHANWCFQSKYSNISAKGLHFSAFHFKNVFSVFHKLIRWGIYSDPCRNRWVQQIDYIS